MIFSLMVFKPEVVWLWDDALLLAAFARALLFPLTLLSSPPKNLLANCVGLLEGRPFEAIFIFCHDVSLEAREHDVIPRAQSHSHVHKASWRVAPDCIFFLWLFAWGLYLFCVVCKFIFTFFVENLWDTCSFG